MEKLLVIVTAQELREQLRRVLADQYRVLEPRNPAEAKREFSADLPRVVLLDLELSGEAGGVAAGFQCLEWLTPGTVKTVVLTGERGREVGRRAVQCGAYDFYQKPVEPAELKIIIDRAFHLSQVEEQIARLQGALEQSTAGIEGIAGQCAALKEAFEALQRVKRLDPSVSATAGASAKAMAGPAPASAVLGPCACEANGSFRYPFPAAEGVPSGSLTLREVRDRVEKGMIAAAVDNCGGNMVKASELLGISRPALYDLMKKHGIFKPSTRH
jgi:DNA-binding NtrC family response regulator